ncbi:RagB/SusD family nutrient uptake outer membrane protein [Chitinophaga sp. Cy-1792]|uniref:RagB/SusD family nutrient uptake outer membrane protein n=1 Tax=Chitinophaga sp. Cy-1792 TaxID=2608339 RepID=UPI0014235C68|nr:RagB/SusD family nutrient uptake outer membrane protein [Chitinophaga sp. Cy-1792]NIG54175.1 RagB/SusD family nutrient uptake outer membrane protein [Chitinophaga sp. Cy-1792]
MKKIFYSVRFAVLVLICITTAFSCSKMLDVKSSRLVSERDYWKSVEDARSALVGVYGLTRAALTDNAAFWMYGEFRMGDFSAVSRTDLKAIVNNDLNVSLPMLQGLKSWRRFYAAINAANLFIERSGEIAKKDPYYSQTNNNVDVAQARALRAFLYFYMVRIWGDVPLVVSSFDGNFPQLPRTPEKEVLAFAEKELIAAAKGLPFVYGIADPVMPGAYFNLGYDFWKGSLINKVSAYAVLAHIAAWQQHYADVMSYTQFIFDNYQSANITFTNSTEELCKSDSGFFYRMGPSQMLNFSFDYNNGEGITAGHLEDYTLAKPITSKLMPDLFVPKDTIIKMFTWDKDERFSLDITTGYPATENYFVNYNTNTPVFSKIKVIQDGKADKGTFRMFNGTMMFTRMEELALLRAEAAVVTNNTAEATSWLRQVMVSRGIPSPLFTNVDLLDEIFRERRRELLGEGWRWYDQVRYARLRPGKSVITPLLQNGGIYWPVADDVLAANPKLTQNSYWNK